MLECSELIFRFTKIVIFALNLEGNSSGISANYNSTDTNSNSNGLILKYTYLHYLNQFWIGFNINC